MLLLLLVFFINTCGADEDQQVQEWVWTVADAEKLVHSRPHSVEVRFAGREADDTCLMYMNYLPNLKYLNASRSGVTSRGVSELRAAKGLKVLLLLDTNMDEDLAPSLRHFPNLQEIALSGTAVGDETCRSLAVNCRALRNVRLEATKITDVGIAHLSNCEHLEYLEISGCKSTTDAAGESLAKLKNLQVLRSTRTSFADESCKKIAGLPKLHRLAITRTQVTDKGVLALAGSRTIKELYLWDTHVGDAGIKGLVGLPLEELDLRETKITDAAIADIAAIRTLKIVRISKTAISQDGGFRLKKLRPDLQIE